MTNNLKKVQSDLEKLSKKKQEILSKAERLEAEIDELEKSSINTLLDGNNSDRIDSKLHAKQQALVQLNHFLPTIACKEIELKNKIDDLQNTKRHEQWLASDKKLKETESEILNKCKELNVLTDKYQEQEIALRDINPKRFTLRRPAGFGALKRALFTTVPVKQKPHSQLPKYDTSGKNVRCPQCDRRNFIPAGEIWVRCGSCRAAVKQPLLSEITSIPNPLTPLLTV